MTRIRTHTRTWRMLIALAAGGAVSGAIFAGDDVTFINETATRLLGPASVGVDDTEERDYIWGDVDNDGDIDLIIARKQIGTTPGRRANVLLMNEDGVLTDRTAERASDSDIAGDVGFLTPTNDRDVKLADLNGDGWLDVITAPALTDNMAKHVSHPRIYINLGEADDVWLGFRYEDARIPQMHATAGPRFCSVAVGDINGDGAPDLFFTDYDSGGTQIFDYNDRLLVNDGDGFFTDDTTVRLTPEMYVSTFGVTCHIVDINNDGLNDIVRLDANGDPYHVGVAYNGGAGVFTDYEHIYTLSGYHSEVGDLNNDGRLDVIVVDDGLDRYLLNQGNDGAGQADFIQYTLPDVTGVFFDSGNITIADIDGDGWNDIFSSTVDVDSPNCAVSSYSFRNQGDPPNVTFVEDDFSLPASSLIGVFDVAAFDVNGDDLLDLVIGRCTGTEVWIREPPIDIAFSYPAGLPEFITPGETLDLDVQIDTLVVIVPGSVEVMLSINGDPFAALPASDEGGGLYRAALPAGVCTDAYRFHVSAELKGAGVFTDPSTAPIDNYDALVAIGEEVTLEDDIEGDVSSWTIVNDAALATGAWEQADPNATFSGGNLASPEDDATPGAANVLCFVTENGEPGGTSGVADVDGGPTTLISPAFDLSGTDATVSFAAWFFCSEEGVPGSEDFLVVEVTANGADWIPVEQIAGTGSTWEPHAFVVGDYITPSAAVQVRFVASDHLAAPASSVVEAGVDDFEVSRVICEGDSCPADLSGDGIVDAADLAIVLGQWGRAGSADLSGNGTVGPEDLAILLGAWGACG